MDADDEEVHFDISHDEYESYFTKTYEPKILITSSDNPHTVSLRGLFFFTSFEMVMEFLFQKTMHFIRELTKIFPNSECHWRKRSSVKKMVISAKERGYTDVVVINEDRRCPSKKCHLALSVCTSSILYLAS